MFQTIMVLSADPLARYWAPQATVVTGPLCPFPVITMSLVMSQTLTVLSAFAMAKRLVLSGAQDKLFTLLFVALLFTSLLVGISRMSTFWSFPPIAKS